MTEGGGGGEGRKCLQTNPSILTWLAQLVEHYWHVSIKGLFHTERSCMVRLFWWARFALQCKSILFNFFWNTKLFLRLYKDFRPFNLFSSVSWIWITKSDFLLSGNAMVSCNVLSCWTQLVIVFFLRDVKFSRIVIYRSKFRRMDCTLNWNYIHYGGLHNSKYKKLFWFHTRVL